MPGMDRDMSNSERKRVNLMRVLDEMDQDGQVRNSQASPDEAKVKSKGNFYEFFAGGGMARAGLGNQWNCLFANDIDLKKANSYGRFWGDSVLRVNDVGLVSTNDLPEKADLAWASFPCQDLSLAGTGAGLDGSRSGTFWRFWNLIEALRNEDRAPSMIVLENVCGALSSHGGRDFNEIGAAITRNDYRFGAVVVDAVHFVPQSRPRLFIIAVDKKFLIPKITSTHAPDKFWHTRALVDAYKRLSKDVAEKWIWWSLPHPPKRNTTLSDLLEEDPVGINWHSREETQKLLNMMSSLNLRKVDAASKREQRAIGTVYKRTRKDSHGLKVQRAEVRFDDIAGCLRTPAGGSSRQTIFIVDGSDIRSRLISSREAARLMGLPDDYILPFNYNEAYHLVGDGVVVPVVRYIAENILEPILSAQLRSRQQAA